MATYSPDRILVLEDDSDIRNSLVELFASEGFDVISAGSAEEALDILQTEKGKVDVVLSDIRLPNLDGLGFVTEARKIRQDIPVVLMTAYGDVETAVQGLRLGVFDYLRKPFNPDDALKSIRRALSAVRTTDRPFIQDMRPVSPLENTLIGRSSKMQEVFNLI